MELNLFLTQVQHLKWTPEPLVIIWSAQASSPSGRLARSTTYFLKIPLTALGGFNGPLHPLCSQKPSSSAYIKRAHSIIRLVKEEGSLSWTVRRLGTFVGSSRAWTLPLMSYYAKGRRSEKPWSRREGRLKTSSIIMHPRKSSTIAFLVSVLDLKFNRFLFFFFGRKPHYFF